MVDVFLDTGTAMARSQSTARCTREQASLDALGLGVVGDVLNNHAPLTIDIQSAFRASVNDVAGADVTFTSNPVAFFIKLAFVVGIIKVFLLQCSDTSNQVIS